MDQRIFHGQISPDDLVRALAADYNRGNYQVRQIPSGAAVSVQISSRAYAQSGGQTALTITVQPFEDGVSVQVGQQSLFGVAASLGQTAFAAFRNPLSILGRIDDVAQDIESIQLTDQVWNTIERTVRALGAGHQLSDRLRRTVCEYCNTPNPIGEASCVACGAPLGNVQPATCRFCGFVVKNNEKVCPNCGKPL